MKAKDLDKIFDDGEVDINDHLDLSSANKPSKELVNLKIAYEQGVLSGFTKSIVLIRHLQRTLSPHTDTGSQRKILEEAMELISQQIKVNND
tara:strand:+ start:359 stop:634 length:276 start_codon:yes stop_codon:yes gene_type:complete